MDALYAALSCGEAIFLIDVSCAFRRGCSRGYPLRNNRQHGGSNDREDQVCCMNLSRPFLLGPTESEFHNLREIEKIENYMPQEIPAHLPKGLLRRHRSPLATLANPGNLRFSPSPTGGSCLLVLMDPKGSQKPR